MTAQPSPCGCEEMLQCIRDVRPALCPLHQAAPALLAAAEVLAGLWHYRYADSSNEEPIYQGASGQLITVGMIRAAQAAIGSGEGQVVPSRRHRTAEGEEP